MSTVSQNPDPEPTPEPLDDLTPQQCPESIHPDWAVDSEETHTCPWCEIDRARFEAAAVRAAVLDEAAGVAEAHLLSLTGGESAHLARSVASGIKTSLRRMAADTRAAQTGGAR